MKIDHVYREGLPIGWIAIMLAVLASMGGFIFGVSISFLRHPARPVLTFLYSMILARYQISFSCQISCSGLPTAMTQQTLEHVLSASSVKVLLSLSSVSALLPARSSVHRE